MPPPSASESFPAAELPRKIQADVNGRKRKTEGGRPIDLAKDCELLSLVQYECEVTHPEIPNSEVACYPVQRWFRRCQDKKGSFTVETTAWEGSAARQPNIAGELSGENTSSSTRRSQNSTKDK